jgi:transcriptional repressor NrdR
MRPSGEQGMLESGMRCPFCSSRDTRVVDKRDADDVAMTRRRRECQQCNARFTTYERPEMTALMIVKKDGRRQPFNREKLRASIQTACTKRPISAETIERMVDQIESALRKRDGLEVQSSIVGDHVIDRLRALDQVAYIRFASVYRAFADISSFEDELRKLIKS